jgi:hypothetical protein
MLTQKSLNKFKIIIFIKMIIFYFLQDINSIKFRINLYRTIRPLRIQFDQTKLIRLIFFLIQLKIQFKPDSKS